MRIIFALWLALVAGQAVSSSNVISAHTVIPTADDQCSIDGRNVVACDHLARRLRARYGTRGVELTLFIDNARYETVTATLNALTKEGFTDVHVFSIMGTNPSSTVAHWIRLSVASEPNHPFAMALISTEQFTTWREELIVLPKPRYDVVSEFSKVRMSQPPCIPIKEFRPTPPYDIGIAVTLHDENLNEACVMPVADSCAFLADLMVLPATDWAESDLRTIGHVRAELACKTQVSRH
jgi:hypothetical protein